MIIWWFYFMIQGGGNASNPSMTSGSNISLTITVLPLALFNVWNYCIYTIKSSQRGYINYLLMHSVDWVKPFTSWHAHISVTRQYFEKYFTVGFNNVSLDILQMIPELVMSKVVRMIVPSRYEWVHVTVKHWVCWVWWWILTCFYHSTRITVFINYLWIFHAVNSNKRRGIESYYGK